ncbi:chromosomal replication initiator protein DnaA [Brackiella oedipodis]|uniref:chromosomal replication initiator protein DnaA n=1 Tax=Brackiella oedipodis TaxID=124225 RepID=UPI00048B9407|nr:chromosomal replication initiator protein DnaA [Brackiella oedipodis]
MDKFWQSCVQNLAQHLSTDTIDIWIAPLRPLEFDEVSGVLQLVAENPMKRQVAERFKPAIQEQARQWFQQDNLKVEIILPKRKSNGLKATSSQAASRPKTKAPAASASGLVANVIASADSPLPQARVTSDTSEPAVSSPKTEFAQEVDAVFKNLHEKQGKAASLNTSQTFDNLVVGKGNELVAAAARRIADNPSESASGHSYNPFYIYGSTGLGKTHIMQAIGNYVVATRPNLKVRYIHANDYWRDMVSAYSLNKIDEWQKKYLGIDLLLIDDIQFLAKKDRTQEQFFYLFETMVSNNKQIVITSDTFPHKLKDMEPRLVTRFAMGLSVALEPPELEMRVAILQKKMKNRPGFVLPEDSAFFIAKNVRSNVRELEGALTKVVAYAGFRNEKELKVEICREALKDLLSSNVGLITIDGIQKTVAEYFKVRVSDLTSTRRHKQIVMPRQIAMYLCKELTRKSLPTIAEQFGGKNHTTVIHAAKKISKERLVDEELNHQIHVLEQSLKG